MQRKGKERGRRWVDVVVGVGVVLSSGNMRGWDWVEWGEKGWKGERLLSERGVS